MNLSKKIEQKYNLNIKISDFCFDKVHLKFSQKDKIVNEYHHYFYKVNLNDLKIDNKIFKCFSYTDLLNDKRIQEVNSDIVSFVGKITNNY